MGPPRLFQPFVHADTRSKRTGLARTLQQVNGSELPMDLGVDQLRQR
jgi:hypothetical protein